MEFYSLLSKHYDAIFPIQSPTVFFLSEIVGTPPRQVLDIACGDGGYALALAGRGYQVIAVDVDKGMIIKAIEKAESSTDGHNVQFIEGDMCNLDQLASKISPEEGTFDGTIDLAYCIGNSLVHLPTKTDIRKLLSSIYLLLKPGKKLVIQIINYEHIFSKNITMLPTISVENENLRFERFYEYNGAYEEVVFHTVLHADGVIMENRIPLYPLSSHMLTELLTEAGFVSICRYSDFKMSPYKPEESYHLVMTAEKADY